MSKLQFMSALLRDCLHKTHGLKLLLLSCCLMPSWALPLKSVLLLWQTSHRCAQYPTTTGLRVAEYPSAAFTSQQLQLGSGNERVGRWVEKAYFLNREMHVLAEFPKATIRNTPCFTSSSSGSHLRTAFLSYQQLSSFSTLFLFLHESTGNAGTSTGSHPLNNLFCTFFTHSEKRATQTSPTTQQASSEHDKAKGFWGPCSSKQQCFLYSCFTLQLWTTRSFQGSSH